MKNQEILICPTCGSENIDVNTDAIECIKCSESYDIIKGKPFLLSRDSEIKSYFKSSLTNETRQKVFSINKFFPTQRIWSNKSINLLKKIILENDPRKGSNVLNIGSGSEKVYQKIYKEVDNDIIRIGLPDKGKIDIYGDLMNLPLKSESIDVVISSSVLEHIKNPELAVSEMNRICVKGGKVYAEIPFMRGFHMEPIDYQRYTISGIEELFKRHGFELIEKGVCSGTMNAMVLIWIDFVRTISPPGFKMISRFLFSWILHPLKFIDKLSDSPILYK